MEFVVEHWISAGPYVAEEEDREEDGLGDSELKVEGAVWKEAAEESWLERSTGGEGNGATAATKEVMGGKAPRKKMLRRWRGCPDSRAEFRMNGAFLKKQEKKGGGRGEERKRKRGRWRQSSRNQNDKELSTQPPTRVYLSVLHSRDV
jgi:hypothetical protein